MVWQGDPRFILIHTGNGDKSGLVQFVRQLGIDGVDLPAFSALTVTVPGAAALWEDVIKKYGKLTLKEVRWALATAQ